MENGTDFPLNAPRDVDVASIGGHQYAIVMTFDEQFHTINVTDPENPSAVGALFDVGGNLTTDREIPHSLGLSDRQLSLRAGGGYRC